MDSEKKNGNKKKGVQLAHFSANRQQKIPNPTPQRAQKRVARESHKRDRKPGKDKKEKSTIRKGRSGKKAHPKNR